MEGDVGISQEKVRSLAKQILESEPGGMEAPNVAELAMLLVSTLVFQSSPDKREAAIAQLEEGFRAAIADGRGRGALRDRTLAEAKTATKQ